MDELGNLMEARAHGEKNKEYTKGKKAKKIYVQKEALVDVGQLG